MFDAADRKVTEWIGNVLPSVQVALAAPSDGSKVRGIGLYLLEVAVDPPLRTAKRPPLQVNLRYLITAWDEKEEAAHRLLGTVVFAAMEAPDWEVDPEPVPVELWRAFGVAPRPSIVLRVPFRKPRPETVAPRVRVPLVIETTPLGELSGVVLGPQDIPLMSARVEIPELDLSAETNPEGEFIFRGIPLLRSLKELRVRAKGKEMTVDVESVLKKKEPLIIRINLMEEEHA